MGHKILINQSMNETVVAASWSVTAASTTVTAAVDCNSTKTSVAVSLQGTVAPLPSIGVVPSSPDDVEVSQLRQSVGLSQSSAADDHGAETATSENDSPVCCTDFHVAIGNTCL